MKLFVVCVLLSRFVVNKNQFKQMGVYRETESERVVMGGRLRTSGSLTSGVRSIDAKRSAPNVIDESIVVVFVVV
jgi:hypothetical protein